MGQYYRVGFIDDEGNLTCLCPYKAGFGAKLLEHGYYGNRFMNDVTKVLYNHPMRVCWMGDYGNTFDGMNYESKADESFIEDIFNRIWEHDGLSCETIDVNSINPDVSFDLYKPLPRYLVNYTLKKYIDLSLVDDMIEEYGRALHPLCIMTACGNGRGGGDYFGKNSCVSGDWAFDLIGFSDEKPEDFSEEPCDFEID